MVNPLAELNSPAARRQVVVYSPGRAAPGVARRLPPRTGPQRQSLGERALARGGAAENVDWGALTRKALSTKAAMAKETEAAQQEAEDAAYDELPWYKKGLGMVLGNPVVRTALYPLDVLATGGRAITAGVEELGELYDQWDPPDWVDYAAMATGVGGYIANVDSEETAKDDRSFFEKVKPGSDYGYGQLINQDAPDWVKNIVGFSGDVVFDPLTYVTGGAQRIPGTIGRAEKLAKAAEATERAAQIGKGLEFATYGDEGVQILRAAAEQQALARRLTEEAGTLGTKPVSLHGGRKAREQIFGEISEKAPHLLENPEMARALTRAGERGFNTIRDPALREALGLVDPSLRFAGMRIPKTGGLVYQGARGGGLLRAGVNRTPFLGKGLSKFSSRGLEGSSRVLSRGAEGDPLLEATAVGISNLLRQGTGQFEGRGNRMLTTMLREFRKLGGEDRLRQLFREGETQATPNRINQFFGRDLPELYRKITGRELHLTRDPNTYIPHITAPRARRFMRENLDEATLRDIHGPEFTKDDLLEGSKYLEKSRKLTPDVIGQPKTFKIGDRGTITLVDGTIDELNEQMGALFPEFKGKFYMDDPADIAESYISSVARQAGRDLALDRFAASPNKLVREVAGDLLKAIEERNVWGRKNPVVETVKAGYTKGQRLVPAKEKGEAPVTAYDDMLAWTKHRGESKANRDEVMTTGRQFVAAVKEDVKTSRTSLFDSLKGLRDTLKVGLKRKVADLDEQVLEITARLGAVDSEIQKLGPLTSDNVDELVATSATVKANKATVEHQIKKIRDRYGKKIPRDVARADKVLQTTLDHLQKQEDALAANFAKGTARVRAEAAARTEELERPVRLAKEALDKAEADFKKRKPQVVAPDRVHEANRELRLDFESEDAFEAERAEYMAAINDLRAQGVQLYRKVDGRLTEESTAAVQATVAKVKRGRGARPPQPLEPKAPIEAAPPPPPAAAVTPEQSLREAMARQQRVQPPPPAAAAPIPEAPPVPTAPPVAGALSEEELKDQAYFTTRIAELQAKPTLTDAERTEVDALTKRLDDLNQRAAATPEPPPAAAVPEPEAPPPLPQGVKPTDLVQEGKDTWRAADGHVIFRENGQFHVMWKNQDYGRFPTLKAARAKVAEEQEFMELSMAPVPETPAAEATVPAPAEVTPPPEATTPSEAPVAATTPPKKPSQRIRLKWKKSDLPGSPEVGPDGWEIHAYDEALPRSQWPPGTDPLNQPLTGKKRYLAVHVPGEGEVADDALRNRSFASAREAKIAVQDHIKARDVRQTMEAYKAQSQMLMGQPFQQPQGNLSGQRLMPAPPPEPGMVRLYRGDYATPPKPGAGLPDWIKRQPEMVARDAVQGRWFHPDEAVAARYPMNRDPEELNRLSYVDVTPEEYAQFQQMDEATKALSRDSGEAVLPPEVMARVQAYMQPELTTEEMVANRAASQAVPRQQFRGRTTPQPTIAERELDPEAAAKLAEAEALRPAGQPTNVYPEGVPAWQVAYDEWQEALARSRDPNLGDLDRKAAAAQARTLGAQFTQKKGKYYSKNAAQKLMIEDITWQLARDADEGVATAQRNYLHEVAKADAQTEAIVYAKHFNPITGLEEATRLPAGSMTGFLNEPGITGREAVLPTPPTEGVAPSGTRYVPPRRVETAYSPGARASDRALIEEGQHYMVGPHVYEYDEMAIQAEGITKRLDDAARNEDELNALRQAADAAYTDEVKAADRAVSEARAAEQAARRDMNPENWNQGRYPGQDETGRAYDEAKRNTQAAVDNQTQVRQAWMEADQKYRAVAAERDEYLKAKEDVSRLERAIMAEYKEINPKTGMSYGQEIIDQVRRGEVPKVRGKEIKNPTLQNYVQGLQRADIELDDLEQAGYTYLNDTERRDLAGQLVAIDKSMRDMLNQRAPGTVMHAEAVLPSKYPAIEGLRGPEAVGAPPPVRETGRSDLAERAYAEQYNPAEPAPAPPPAAPEVAAPHGVPVVPGAKGRAAKTPGVQFTTAAEKAPTTTREVMIPRAIPEGESGFLAGEQKVLQEFPQEQPVRPYQPVTERQRIAELEAEAERADALNRPLQDERQRIAIERAEAAETRTEAQRAVDQLAVERDDALLPLRDQAQTLKNVDEALNDKAKLIPKREQAKADFETITDLKINQKADVAVIADDIGKVAKQNPELVDDDLAKVEGVLHDAREEADRLTDNDLTQQQVQKAIDNISRKDTSDVDVMLTTVGKNWRMLYQATGKKKAVLQAGDTILEAELHRRFVNLYELKRDRVLFGRNFNAFTNLFKTYATLTPGFHVRNALSAIFMNTSDGVGLKTQLSAAGLWKRYMDEGEAFIDNPTGDLRGFTAKQVQDAFAVTHSTGAGGRFTEQGFANVAGEGGWGERVTAKLQRNRFTRLSQRAGERVEGSVRFAMALDSMKAGENIDSAIQRVNRVHFDYSDISKLDDTMKRLIPFWTFMSRNMPLQVSQMWTKPRAYLIYQDFVNNFSADNEQFTPEYWTKAGAFNTGLKVPKTGIPILKEAGGLPIYLSPDLGFTRLQSDLKDYEDFLSLRRPGAVLSQANPALTAPVEWITRKDIFTGQVFEEGETVPAKGIANWPIQIAARLSGQETGGEVDAAFANFMRAWNPLQDRSLRLLPQAGGSDPEGLKRQLESLARVGLGLPVRTLTPEQQVNEQRRQYFELSDKLKQDRARAQRKAG